MGGTLDNRDRLELRRRRMEQAPPVLRGGFRPFFLGAGIWAAITIAIWLWAFSVGVPQIGALDPLAWHRHEMLFGFVGAVIAGFALTAVPNWTGRLPIAGAPLAALALWWLLARALPFAAPELPLALLALVDGGFYLALAALILREIVLAKNRNLPVVLAIALFGLADLLDYAGSAGLIGYDIGHRAGIALAVTLVSLIGGRIVPSFTRNWMQREGLTGSLPSQPTRFDIAVVLATALALGAWMLAGAVPPVGAALVFAGSIQLVRLARWRGWRTLASPIVLVLHLGYVWIPLGLLLLGATGFGAPIPASAGVHALTVGALAGMILAVMTRATLGHTGRALHAGPATRASYLALHLAVLARVAASLVPVHYQSLLHIAGGLWIAAFALFVLAYAPVMLRSRPGE
ncbi:NnrS family protein [Erythrobacter sp. SN021]|uniref:NnrS family protein n=1 Tax=Erythrobacter sp. SN021 TaxID=2912574 RepID=UPI001F24BD6F|nr:NnrS family protein [Erythrobacter sp. SN021]MCF8882041.1 NnrS family protein [Erythrobacter sp. SN021]